MLDGGSTERRAALSEAIQQARQAAGDVAALRVLEVDPESRLPERRAVLAPFPDPNPNPNP
jgi:protein ImuB